MKVRFTTSVGSVRGGGFIEGRVIEPTEITPELQRWLDSGVLVPVKESGEEISTPATPAEETATTAPPRRSSRRAAAQAAAATSE